METVVVTVVKKIVVEVNFVVVVIYDIFAVVAVAWKGRGGKVSKLARWLYVCEVERSVVRRVFVVVVVVVVVVVAAAVS